MGKSGFGKTTLLKLISGIEKPNNGKITVDKIDKNSISDAEWMNKIGYVTQENILFNCSITDNMKYVKEDVSIEEIKKACTLAEIHEFIDSLPEKYNTVIGEHGYKLSGGQRQRLAIARILLKNPRILLLDEATASLDAENEKKILLNIMDICKKQKSAIIIVAHRKETLSICDTIIGV